MIFRPQKTIFRPQNEFFGPRNNFFSPKTNVSAPKANFSAQKRILIPDPGSGIPDPGSGREQCDREQCGGISLIPHQAPNEEIDAHAHEHAHANMHTQTRTRTQAPKGKRLMIACGFLAVQVGRAAPEQQAEKNESIPKERGILITLVTLTDIPLEIGRAWQIPPANVKSLPLVVA